MNFEFVWHETPVSSVFIFVRFVTIDFFFINRSCSLQLLPTIAQAAAMVPEMARLSALWNTLWECTKYSDKEYMCKVMRDKKIL